MPVITTRRSLIVCLGTLGPPAQGRKSHRDTKNRRNPYPNNIRGYGDWREKGPQANSGEDRTVKTGRRSRSRVQVFKAPIFIRLNASNGLPIIRAEVVDHLNSVNPARNP